MKDKTEMKDGYYRVGPESVRSSQSKIPREEIPKEVDRQRLNVKVDPRGSLWELWRESWDIGEVRQAYISVTHPDMVKGWHLHENQQDKFVCVRGRVIVALYRPEWDGKVEEIVLDSEMGSPVLLVIPPGTAHGWYNPGTKDAWILNLVSEEYSMGSDEYRRPADHGPVEGVMYDWRQGRDG